MSDTAPARPVIYTYREYFAAMLTALGVKPRRANLRACAAVSLFEATSARFNPLAVTQYEQGATPFNTFGGDMHVYNYPNESTGVHAAAVLFSGSHWAGVIRAMRRDPFRFGMLRAWDAAYTWVPGIDFNRLEPHAAQLDRQLARALPGQL